MIPRLCRASRAPAASKSRTVSFSSPCLARTRLFPGVHPRPASVGRGSHLRWQDAHRVFVFAVPRTHAVFRVCTLARLLLAGARTCGEQDAHRVCAFAQPRTHAVVSGCAPSPGFCWPGLAPAVGKTRTVFVPLLSLARTRLFPGARPHGFCWPGPAAAPGKSPALRFTCAYYIRKAVSKAREWTNFFEHLFAFIAALVQRAEARIRGTRETARKKKNARCAKRRRAGNNSQRRGNTNADKTEPRKDEQ